MSDQIIRDVVYRVSIQQQDAKLKAPDTSAFKRANDALQKEIAKNRKLVDDLSGGVKQYGDTAVEAARASGAAFQDTAVQAATLREQQLRMTDANLRMADSLKQAGDGAFTFARGLALVATTGDDDLAKVVRTIARFQGAFDIFRGGVDLIRGAVEANRAYRASVDLVTAAEIRRAQATAAASSIGGIPGRGIGGVAGRGAAGLLGRVAGAGGGYGVGIAAVGALVLTGVQAWREWKRAAEDAGDAAANAMDRTARKINRVTEALSRSNEGYGRGQTFAQRRLDLLSPEQQINAIPDLIADARRSPVPGGIESRQALLASLGIRLGVTAPARDQQSVDDIANRLRHLRGPRGRELIGGMTESLRNELALRRRGARLRGDERRDGIDAVEEEIEQQRRLIAAGRRQQEQIAVERGSLAPLQRQQYDRLLGRATDADGASDLRAEELRRLGQLAPTLGGDIARREFARREGATVAGTPVEGGAERLEAAQERLKNLEAEQDRLVEGNERRHEVEIRTIDRLLEIMEVFEQRAADIQRQINLANEAASD